jgi:hypothetical protein
MGMIFQKSEQGFLIIIILNNNFASLRGSQAPYQPVSPSARQRCPVGHASGCPGATPTRTLPGPSDTWQNLGTGGLSATSRSRDKGGGGDLSLVYRPTRPVRT